MIVETSKEVGPSGLGGWLTLVGLGVIFTPIRLTAGSLEGFVDLFSNGAWQILTTPGSEQYHPLWAPLLIFEMLGNGLFILTSIVLAVLFFRRSGRFPRFYILFAVVNLIFLLVDAWLGSYVVPNEVPLDAAREILRALGGMVWVPYMLLSKRVRNTFVD